MKFNLQGAQLAGDLAENVYGDQNTAHTIRYGQNSNQQVEHLLDNLREVARSFPPLSAAAAQIHIEDLAADLSQDERPDSIRLKARLMALFQVAIMLGGGVATATAFTNNLLSLSEKLEVPVATFQPQLAELKQIHAQAEWGR